MAIMKGIVGAPVMVTASAATSFLVTLPVTSSPLILMATNWAVVVDRAGIT